MIELIVKRYLDNRLQIPLYFEFEDNMTDKFLIISKTGSGYDDHLHRSVVVIQSYAPSLFEAAELNNQVKQLMLELDSQEEVVGVHLNSDYNFTDVSLKKYRYQAVFDISHY